MYYGSVKMKNSTSGILEIEYFKRNVTGVIDKVKGTNIVVE